MSDPYRGNTVEVDLEHRVDALEATDIDILGKSGNNGRLGRTNGRIDEIEKRLDKGDSRRWAVILFLLTTLATVITTAVITGRWMGRIETEVETLKSRVNRTRSFTSTPDAPAARDNTP